MGAGRMLRRRSSSKPRIRIMDGDNAGHTGCRIDDGLEIEGSRTR
jgi:hypothetical protein